MDANLLSGLLLAAVVLGGGGYLIKEMLGHRIKVFMDEHRAEPPGGTNSHLLGAVGRVVGDGGPGEMRVRVGMERWTARLAAPEEGSLPVGTEVEVRAVRGRMLEVAERSASSPAG